MSARRQLFVVIRFDAFQMDDGKPFNEQFVTVKPRVYTHQVDAEAEAARLTLQAPSGAHYFTRLLVDPSATEDAASAREGTTNRRAM